MPPIQNIPPDNVGEVVQEYVDNGTESIRVDKQTNGNYTVTPM